MNKHSTIVINLYIWIYQMRAECGRNEKRLARRVSRLPWSHKIDEVCFKWNI